MVKHSKKTALHFAERFFSLPPKPDVGFGGRLQIRISFEAGLAPSSSPAALFPLPWHIRAWFWHKPRGSL